MFSRIIGSFRPCVFQILKLRVSWWHLSPNKKTRPRNRNYSLADMSDYDESEPIKYPQCFWRTQHKRSVWSKRPQKAPFGRKGLSDLGASRNRSGKVGLGPVPSFGTESSSICWIPSEDGRTPTSSRGVQPRDLYQLRGLIKKFRKNVPSSRRGR